ncbi:hypothetical protein [Acinetobacter proteolyticus]|uniref:Uncharacterized protein n=1 Tax=Acinetobacter proteolyticus TaxID=1776741 RepID=A0A2N0WI93_9GAMM|nr:hypothetical protein [Acinetobacter proteolyticus]PKF35496.1 hypothetical protein CW311_04190 [Acinetobacter proteolyticus]
MANTVKRTDKRALTRVKKRFNYYRSLTLLIGSLSAFAWLNHIYETTFTVTGCMAGASCAVDINAMGQTYYVVGWLVLEALIFTAFYLAIKVDDVAVFLVQLKKNILRW